MRTILLAAALLPLALPAAAAPPTWTILKQICWKLSQSAGQCAVGLYGEFLTYEACLAANGGKLQRDAATPDGLKIGWRCQIKFEGEF